LVEHDDLLSECVSIAQFEHGVGVAGGDQDVCTLDRRNDLVRDAPRFGDLVCSLTLKPVNALAIRLTPPATVRAGAFVWAGVAKSAAPAVVASRP
jgi:hypothetical protein